MIQSLLCASCVNLLRSRRLLDRFFFFVKFLSMYSSAAAEGSRINTKRTRRRQAAIRIRRAKHRDAAAIESLLYESFLEYERAYTPEAFHITTPGKHEIETRIKQWTVWVGLYAKVMVGTVSAHPEGEALHIRSMAVRPAMRGQGIGKLLLKHVEGFALANGYKRLILNTTPFLASAIRLYERFGFRAIGSERDWFGTRLSAMVKQVTQTHS
jgi:GNAT superfamily N-acetyltransferase